MTWFRKCAMMASQTPDLETSVYTPAHYTKATTLNLQEKHRPSVHPSIRSRHLAVEAQVPLPNGVRPVALRLGAFSGGASMRLRHTAGHCSQLRFGTFKSAGRRVSSSGSLSSCNSSHLTLAQCPKTPWASRNCLFLHLQKKQARCTSP